LATGSEATGSNGFLSLKAEDTRSLCGSC
jgi:hypothetical protein